MAAQGLKSELFPTLDPGLVTVSVPYPGATPSEVASGITQRVDEAVRSIDGVDRVVSVASEGYGRTTIELKEFVNSEDARSDVQAAVDLIADFPPQDAEEPEVTVGTVLHAVLTVMVTSDGDENHLDRSARQLEEALRALPLVSHVSIEGVRDYEISIEVSEESLQEYGLTFDELAQTIRRNSVNLSSGEIRSVSGDLLIRTEQEKSTAEEFENIAIRTLPGGTVLTLGDVATVLDGYTDDEFIMESDGERAVFIRIRKSDAGNVLKISQQVEEFLETYPLPPGVSVEVWENQSDILGARLNLLIRNGALGFALVMIFLVLMLDLRLAFWVAMGVPISFLGAFIFFDFMGLSMNMISLFSLIIVLGIVVDDAIVVGENIGSEQQKGLTGSEASIAGVRGVFSPVFVGVVTTMAAFAPLLFVTGTFGQILSTLPLIVIIVLTISLIEVFFILPAHLSESKRWSAPPLSRIQNLVAEKVQYFRDTYLTKGVKYAVENRYVSLVYALGLLAVAAALIINGTVRIEFFPQVESDRVLIYVDYPVGTPFEVTDSATRRIHNAAQIVDNNHNGTAIRAIAMMSGARETEGPDPGAESRMSFQRNVGSLEIQLNPEPLRTISANQIAREIRLEAGEIPGAQSVRYLTDIFAETTELEYELIHQDYETLRLAVYSMRDRMTDLPMLTGIRDSMGNGKRQFDIGLTPAGKAAGLTPAMVARQLRQSFFGDEVQRIQRGRDEVKIMLRYPREDRRSTAEFFDARIRLQDGTQVPLTTVANVEESRSFSSINRVDGNRVITIAASVDPKLASSGEAGALIGETVIPSVLAEFPGLSIQSAGFSREQSEDFASLQTLGAIALLVIFTLIAGQLRSYTMPLVVLSAIPFGAAGAVIGHYLLGFNLSMVSIFGIIALSGVVVNDSLVLVDRYRRLRSDDPTISVKDAIIEATRLRFRAVFLTTATTAMGLTPMLFERSIQAQFLVPMAVSLAVGILFASIIIIFLVPSLVVIRDDLVQIATQVTGFKKKEEGDQPERALR